ncbi:MAG: sugar phosphate isomerase/epimerase family protein [Anaerolineaceae bacterium]|jgi:xylose isomerase|nr:sugar phosphate isomerase/epimerase family protein [Anaerolineaceae bacterium]
MKGLGIGAWAFGMGSERYVSDGYKPFIPLEERMRRIAAIEGLDAVEICYPNDVTLDNIDEIRQMLDEHGLKVSGLGVELVCDREWMNGSFTSTDPARREKSVQLTCEAMDVAAALGVDTVSLWLGQDGFDYAFQADYVEAWDNLVEGLRTAASYREDINLGIEYKTSEPQMACYVNSGGKALALALATGRDNVGITLDIGHALNARENPAEIAAILLSSKRLFHLHLNDNYSWSDDDMPIGTVHFMQFLELFYWMEKLGYDGWMSLDLYPYREDPAEACETSVHFVNKLMEKARDAGFQKLVEENRSAGSRAIRKIYQLILGE